MRKNKTNDNIFTNETRLSFYLLGVFMTDGCISITKTGRHKISLSSKDEKWLETIKNLIVPGAKISPDRNCFGLYFCSNIIEKWLMSYGCIPKKSKILKLLKPIPEQFIFDFFRGVIDGDGCVSTSYITQYVKSGPKKYKKFAVFITCGSVDFAKQLHEMINKYHKCHLYTMNKKAIYVKSNGKTIAATTLWSVQLCGKEAKRFSRKVYYKNNCLNLSRKQKIVNENCYDVI